MVGNASETADLLRRARAGDGEALALLKKREEPTAAYDRALLVQPDQPRLWLARARRYVELKRWKQAESDLDRAVRLGPKDPQTWAERALFHAGRGRPGKSASDFAKALSLLPAPKDPWWDDRPGVDELARLDDVFPRVVKLRPKDRSLWAARAGRYASRARWREASAALARAIELDPADHLGWFLDAPLRLELGDAEGYRRVCREMVKRFGETDKPEVAERTAKTCLLAPNEVKDIKLVTKLADRAVTGTEHHGYYRWFLLARGMAHYRAGEYGAAVDRLHDALTPGEEANYLDALAHLFLAMAHHRLGKAGEARESLERARTIMEEAPAPEKEGLGAGWADWLRYQIVRREAEALLKTAGARRK
jgi:tetratricopeptide (TPR) repeat protein